MPIPIGRLKNGQTKSPFAVFAKWAATHSKPHVDQSKTYSLNVPHHGQLHIASPTFPSLSKILNMTNLKWAATHSMPPISPFKTKMFTMTHLMGGYT